MRAEPSGTKRERRDLSSSTSQEYIERLSAALDERLAEEVRLVTATAADAPAAAQPAATEPPTSPYRGLRPYTEADAAFFFGREAEREIVAANLLGRAADAPVRPKRRRQELRPARRRRQPPARALRGEPRRRRRQPASPVVVVRSWADPDPLTDDRRRRTREVARRCSSATIFLTRPSARRSRSVLAPLERAGAGQAARAVSTSSRSTSSTTTTRRGAGTFDAEFPQAVNRAGAAGELPALDSGRLARTARPLQGQDPEPVREPAADRPPDARCRAGRREAADLGSTTGASGPEQRVEIEEELVERRPRRRCARAASRSSPRAQAPCGTSAPPRRGSRRRSSRSC